MLLFVVVGYFGLNTKKCYIRSSLLIFKEEIITESKFQDGYKSSFKNLGITGDFIIRVTVYENNEVYGDFLYAPKEDKIITRYEGLFLNAFRE